MGHGYSTAAIKSWRGEEKWTVWCRLKQQSKSQINQFYSIFICETQGLVLTAEPMREADAEDQAHSYQLNKVNIRGLYIYITYINFIYIYIYVYQEGYNPTILFIIYIFTC